MILLEKDMMVLEEGVPERRKAAIRFGWPNQFSQWP